MENLVWIIDEKKQCVKDNPVKLIKPGVLTSLCGHSKKEISNDLIFKTKNDAERYLNYLNESFDIFHDYEFGTERVRHVYITRDIDGKKVTRDFHARVELKESPAYPVGMYNQNMTLSFSNKYKLLKKGDKVTISFLYKNNMQKIDGLSFIGSVGNCWKFTRMKNSLI